MNLVYTFNDKFVPQVAASICSVCENNRNERITFYLIIDGVNQDNQKQLKSFIESYSQKSEIIEVGDIKRYFNFDFDTTGWNPIVLARLVLDKLLPDDLNRVLYLDGDTIVRGDLKELYNTDMGKSVIGASIEPTADRTRKQSLDINGAYYNAGVLLINLKKWRKDKTGYKILSYYAKHNGKLFANDQDAINGALGGEIYTLPLKYNFCNIYNQYPYRFLRKLVAPAEYFSLAEYKDNINNPIIVHYLGEERPWRAGNRHKYRVDYKKYLTLTPWKDTPDEDGWQTYFICWGIFNVVTKAFPSLRYKIITSLIPFFINARAKQNQKASKLKEETLPPISKVSILIPAYNAERLIHKAIDSALSQTYSNIEIIILNDGSTDNTWQVLREYQQKHPRLIRVFSQSNRGTGATRNALLKKATGDYIINLDADDWLKPDYVKTMLRALQEGDIAICGFERYDAKYQFRDKRTPRQFSYAKYKFCTTAGKMFRREFLYKNKLCYKDINIGEDEYFNVISYAKTNQIVILSSYSGYCCYESSHSSAHTAKYSKSRSFFALMQELVERLRGSNILRDPNFQFYAFKDLLMDVFLYKNSLSSQDLIKIYRRSIKWYIEFLRQNNSSFHLRFQKGETFSINLVVNSFIILTKFHLDSIALRIIKRIPIYIL